MTDATAEAAESRAAAYEDALQAFYAKSHEHQFQPYELAALMGVMLKRIVEAYSKVTGTPHDEAMILFIERATRYAWRKEDKGGINDGQGNE